MQKRVVWVSFVSALLLTVVYGLNKSLNYGSFKDSRDGQTYKTIKIGEQTWMAENMNYELPDSYCYGDKVLNCVNYGRLYSLKSAKEACPAGWRLPTPLDWSVLIFSIGGESVAGQYLKSTEGWLGGGNGTDDYGFSALPAGAKYGESNYGAEGKSAFFWGTPGDSRGDAYAMVLDYYNTKAVVESEVAEHWLSVRCVKVETPNSSSSAEQNSSAEQISSAESVSSSSVAAIPAARGSRMEGDFLIDLRDNQVYKTVKIGTQTWMAENLNYNVENSSCDLVMCTESGRSYTWDAAMNACPDGWHLPTRAEWKTLISFAGGKSVAGKMLRGKASGSGGERMRGPFIEFYRVDGTDEFGFLALEPNYWSSTEDDKDNAYHIDMPSKDGSADVAREAKSKGLHVRCLLGEAERAEQKKQDKIVAAFTDKRDGKTYRTVAIGEQTWMAENLNYETENSYCYDDNVKNCALYGRLYEWEVANVACPDGWHLPSIEDWEDLIITVGNRDIAALELKSKSGWNDSIAGLDKYGFSALPAGYKYGENFGKGGLNTEWWSTTNSKNNKGFKQTVALEKDNMKWTRSCIGNAKNSPFPWNQGYKPHRFSIENFSIEKTAIPVRCLKNKAPKVLRKVGVVKAAPLKDARDGHTYKTVKIGSQTWMAENLNYKTKNSFCHGDSIAKCKKYGRFYTWYGAIQCEEQWIDEDGDGSGYMKWCDPKPPVRGVCPDGWHLPSLREWTIMISDVGGEKIAGTELKSKNGWAGGMNGSDDYGFAALPVVYHKSYEGEFTENNDKAEFWSSTQFEGDKQAYYMGLTTSEDTYYFDRAGRESHIAMSGNHANLLENSKESKMSVRCVKDGLDLSNAKDEKRETSDESVQQRNVSGESVVDSSAVLPNHVEGIVEGLFTDSRDGHVYKTVTIGTQTWMAQNLSYNVENSICKGDSTGVCAKYGRLYSWNLAKEACPTGWRLPMRVDWDTLFAAVGGQSVAGKYLKSSTEWYGHGNGSDAYGFSALPVNVFSHKDYEGFFSSGSVWNSKIGRSAFFWSFDNGFLANAVYLLYYSDNAFFYSFPKDNAFSVRCIKGDLSDGSKKKMIEDSLLTDARDGRTYKTVKIGKQVWMAEDLNFATPDSYCSSDSTKKDSASYCDKYGRYYKWSDAMDSAGVYSQDAKGCGAEKNCIPTYPVHGICPTGWHLPSQIEWNVLFAFVGGMESAGKALKTVTGWNGDAIGSDDYGFSAIPGGGYWSSTEKGYSLAYSVGVYGDWDKASLNLNEKQRERNRVRCVNDGNIDDNHLRQANVAVSDSKLDSSLLVDTRDGQIYRTVTIGKQTWMAENLNYETEYSECSDDNVIMCSKFGRLYPWSLAMDSAAVYSENGKECGYRKACFPTEPVRGICPDGWHLPTSKEWGTLLETVGGPSSAQVALKAVVGWKNDRNGMDKFGFSALPTSLRHVPYRYSSDRKYNAAFFWSSSKYDADEAFAFVLHDRQKDKPIEEIAKNSLLNIRCVKNDPPQVPTETSDSLSGKSSAWGVMKDPRDGQTYKTVTFGNYTWMAENIKYETEHSNCYDDDTINCVNNGRLYEWQALKTVCPVGWHLPTEAEWDTLFVAVGGASVAGKKLKSKKDWLDCKSKTGLDKDGNGTDEFDFTVRPVGIYSGYGYGPVTQQDGYMACFHTAEKDDKSMEVEMCFDYCQDSVVRTDNYTYKAISVRCIKDYPKKDDGKKLEKKSSSVIPPSSVEKGSLVDSRDRQTYKTVKIGSQTWMAQNLNFKTEKSLCFDFDSTSCAEFGSIYTWADAMKACPAGWRLPTEKDWKTLINAVGDSTTAANALKSSEGWVGYKDVNGGGPDEYGFSVQPVGCWWSPPDEMSDEGSFSIGGYNADFWTSKELDDDKALIVGMGYFYGNINMREDLKANGYSVRCVMD